MKTKHKCPIPSKFHSFGAVCMVAILLMFGALTGSAQTGDYLYSRSEQTITLNPGTYDITAYGAQGGEGYAYVGGLGAEMEGEFSFSRLTTLTLLVGGIGGFGLEAGGGGGGGSFVVNGSTPLVIAGGGGGSSNSGEAGGPGLTTTSGGGSNGGISGGGGGGGGGGVESSGGGGGGGGYSGGGSNGEGYVGSGGYSGDGGGGGSSFEAGGGGGIGGGDGNGGFGGGGGDGNSYAGNTPYGPGGGGGGYSGGGGGDGPFGGGGGGSYIDSSAFAVLTEVSGVASPDGSPNGEIIITAVPEPTALALAGLGGLSLLLFRRRRK
jgi:hypothetical protein